MLRLPDTENEIVLSESFISGHFPISTTESVPVIDTVAVKVFVFMGSLRL